MTVNRDRIRELHAQGKSCNAIARDLGVATSTVSRHAKDMGLQWAVDRTKVAVANAQASNRERRAVLVSRMYDRADKIMNRLDAPTFKLVGMDKDGYARTNTVAADAIPGAEERALFGMAINALVAAAKLEAVDAAHSDIGAAKGILGNLQDALQGAYGQLAHAGTTLTSQLEDEPE